MIIYIYTTILSNVHNTISVLMHSNWKKIPNIFSYLLFNKCIVDGGEVDYGKNFFLLVYRWEIAVIIIS